MSVEQSLKEQSLKEWNDLCALHVFPFAPKIPQSLDVIKDKITHAPNAEVTLPIQHPRYISLPSNIALTVALCWNPLLVEHSITVGAHIPTCNWHSDLADVWVLAVKNKTREQVEHIAGDFVRSLQLLQNAGYCFSEYREPNATNDRNRRLSFLHNVAWRLETAHHPEVLFQECVKQGIPVSEDLLTDIKYLNNKVPNLCQQVQHYVLSQAATQAHTSLRRSSKI